MNKQNDIFLDEIRQMVEAALDQMQQDNLIESMEILQDILNMLDNKI